MAIAYSRMKTQWQEHQIVTWNVSFLRKEFFKFVCLTFYCHVCHWWFFGVCVCVCTCVFEMELPQNWMPINLNAKQFYLIKLGNSIAHSIKIVCSTKLAFYKLLSHPSNGFCCIYDVYIDWIVFGNIDGRFHSFIHELFEW